MTYLLASDFHGNFSAYEKFSRIAEALNPSKIALLGDLFGGDGAAPVNHCLRNICAPIVAVRGNCDFSSDMRDLSAGFKDAYFIERVGDRLACFSHGHIYGRHSAPRELFETRRDGAKMKKPIVFYGHYHFPEILVRPSFFAVCVGSAGRPAMSSAPSCCAFDGTTVKILSLEDGSVAIEKTLD